MAVTTTVRWVNEKHFIGVDSGNHAVVLSGQADGIGVKPSEMLLIALASCSSVDVVEILDLREEATRVADGEMSKQRDTGYATLVTLPTTTVSRSFRGLTEVYSITSTVSEFAAVNSKQINVFVEWEYRGKRYNHSITTIVGKP